MFSTLFKLLLFGVGGLVPCVICYDILKKVMDNPDPGDSVTGFGFILFIVLVGYILGFVCLISKGL